MMLEDFFGDIISKARFGLGYTVDQVASAAKMSSQRLISLERGSTRPTQTECAALAQILGLATQALWQMAKEEYRPMAPLGAGAGIRSLKVTRMQSNAYIIRVDEEDRALLIDPGDAVNLLNLAKGAGFTVCGILVTHGHSDHSGAVADVVKSLKVPVLASPLECRVPGMIELSGNGRYTLNDITVQAVACPGHSPGSYSFLVNGRLFTGDALFAGSLGRPASPKDYQDSLRSAYRLLQYPVQTPIFPGHGPVTSVEQERANNPFVSNWFAAQNA